MMKNDPPLTLALRWDCEIGIFIKLENVCEIQELDYVDGFINAYPIN